MSFLSKLEKQSHARLVFDSQEISTKQISYFTQALYNDHIKNTGYKRILCCLPNSPIFFCWHLVCMEYEIEFIPVIYQQSNQVLTQIIQFIKPDLVILTDEKINALCLKNIKSITENRLHLPTDIKLNKNPVPLNSYNVRLQQMSEKHSPALFICGSGTSGKLKVILHSRQSIAGFITTLEEVLQAKPGMTYLIAQPMGHIGGVITILLTLLHNGTAVLLPTFEVSSYLTALLLYQPTHINLHTPLFYELIAHPELLDKQAFKNIQTCFAGGDNIAPDLPTQFTELTGTPMQIGYGTTETGIVLVNNMPYQENKGSIGKVISCAKVEIRQANTGKKIVGKPGEIWIHSPANCLGYYAMPELNQACVVDGWFKPGDIAMEDSANFFWYIGRSSDHINYGQQVIYPGQIELVLYQHDNIAIAAVLSNDTVVCDQTPTLMAFVKLKNPTVKTNEAEILAFVADALKGLSIPIQICILSEIPLNYTGKIDRQALAKQFPKRLNS